MTARDVWRWTDERGVQRLVGTDELRAALAGSLLPASTLVWREGMKEWAPASTLPELASAAFAAEKPNGAKVQDEDSFDARGTLKEPKSRPTLIGVPAPAVELAEPPPLPVPLRAPPAAASGPRPTITQVPPFFDPTAAPSVPKVPAPPSIPTPKAPSGNKAQPKRKPMTSDIDGLWATTTHSDEDETIPRRPRPAELAAAAAAAAEALRNERAKARKPEPPKKPAPTGRTPPPLPVSKAHAAKMATAPRPFMQTSPGIGSQRPPPPPGPPVKPAVPSTPAPVRIKPPQPPGPAAEITGESRTLPLKSVVTLQGMPAPSAAALEATKPARHHTGVTTTLVSAADAIEAAETAAESAPAPAKAARPDIDIARPGGRNDEATETLPRPSQDPTAEPTRPLPPLPVLQASLMQPQPPEAAALTPLPPAVTTAPPGPTPPPSLVSMRLPPSVPPPSVPVDVPRRGLVTVPVSSLLGAGGVLIGMVLGAFFVGRGSTTPPPPLVARPSLGVIPALARAAIPPPPKPCWMVKQPVMWAPKVAHRIPFDVTATKDDGLAVGYARDAKTAFGIEVALASGDIQGRFQDKHDDEIERVVPTPAAEFRVTRADDGGSLKSRLDVPEGTPFAIGIASGSIAIAEPPSAAPKPLWPIAGEDGLDASSVHAAGAGFVLTFRRERAIWGGFIGAGPKAEGELVKIAGSGGAVGKPSAAWNGREVAVIFADRPDPEGKYEIRIGHAAGHVPATTTVLPLPKGGPGGDAFAPDIAGLADGRWLIMWTEGASGSRAVRAQTLDADFTPLGDPIALSPPAGNFGQGAIGIAGGYAATVFLSKGSSSYELWGSVLQCL